VEAEHELAAGISEVLAELGRGGSELELKQIPGGASRQTFLVLASGDEFVLRRDPQGAETFTSLRLETEVIAAAEAAGVPVAPALHFEPDGGRFGSAGYLMDRIEGESVAPRILRRDVFAAARERLPGQLGEALAGVHSVRADAIDGLPQAGANPALAACEFWERQLDEIGEPLPATEAGLRWLRLNAPAPPERVTLVHGDFRLGNLIVDADGLAAVIDWELAHVGDPAEDIGWLCIRSWRFGRDELPVAGVGELDDFMTAYRQAGGERPDSERLRWWEALGNAKWAVICARQAHDHLTGVRRSAELASLGRRICEPEWDLLELIGERA
jgi:aminoglycoside phosphotransferase (APT) family kinase protein